MGNVYADRPEIASASRAFRQEQLEAWLGVELPVCGVEVVALTPRIAMELELAGNGFVAPGEPEGWIEAIQFIHRISKGYIAGPISYRKMWQLLRLRRHLFRQKADQVFSEIRAYLSRTHAARPNFQRSAQPDFVPSDSCWMSYVVDSLCGWYPHLTVQAALDMPYRIMWQLWNRQLEKANPDYRQRAPAVMEARQKYLEELDAKAKADFAAEKERKRHG